MDDSKLDPILDRLFEAGDDERSAELAALKQSDPKSHSKIVELLALEEEAARLIGDSVAEHLTTELASFEADLADALVEGDIVGPYRVIRQIGRGGMGSVYLAHRDDLDRDVALKVIRRGMDTADVLRRFDSERRILAGLNHPNIARLFDSGATTEGLPYFVMEFVDGLPIDRYCDENRLNVTERLRLFEEVCGAVQHAHQALVVHRDLKPSNMLVDANGKVKLLDFGIAKALDDESPDASTRFAGALHALTPEYAAPEQSGSPPHSRSRSH